MIWFLRLKGDKMSKYWEVWLESEKDIFGDTAYGFVGVASVVLVRPVLGKKSGFLASLISDPENTSKKMRANVDFDPQEEGLHENIAINDALLELAMTDNPNIGPGEAIKELIPEAIETLAKRLLALEEEFHKH